MAVSARGREADPLEEGQFVFDAMEEDFARRADFELILATPSMLSILGVF
jgi:hypothetical protein